MMSKILFGSLSVFVSVFAFAAVVHAAQPEQLGKFGDWTSYKMVERGSKICYMVSKPVDAKGNYTRRGEIFALITHRPSENTKDVFSYITGYTYKQGSDATVTIDGKNYILFTQDDTAWAPDAEADGQLAKAIQKGSKMLVKGTSSRGTLTTDTYSLKGSGSAYKAISKECGS
ncbi:MAG: invasion associated locus B family protein [Alphaproteobacteria bacterium]